MLIEQPGVEDAIQLGDVYSMLIKHLHSRDKVQQAYQYYERMTRKKISATKYLDAKIVEDIHRAMGMPSPNEARAQATNDDIEDEIPEDF